MEVLIAFLKRRKIPIKPNFLLGMEGKIMVRNYETYELFNKIKETETVKGDSIKFTFWKCSETKAELVCIIGKGLGVPVFNVWEFNLCEENPRDYIKEAQKLKANIKRHFKTREVTSDFRY